ncbi:MAG: hypothetical protein E7046_14430 [Lentisphaerae bacterium]|nr:hypothetical protein [Lentisphaerota bacterium]
MRSLFLVMSAAACAAMPSITYAEQKTISPGETVIVAGPDISSWAAADIDIGAGATLLFSEPTESVEFTGKITGSGHFVASSAVTTAKPWEFKMNGDATGFTGGFFYTNVLARIVSPTSVGDSARITIYVEYNIGDGAKSHFFGPAAGKPDYIYRNPLDVWVGANKGLVVNARTVLAGDIIHRNGVIHGPGTITGNITTHASTITFADDLHVEGLCSATATGAKIANANTFYLKGATEGFSQFSVINCYKPVYLEGDNLFGENVVLQMGENFTGKGNHSGRLELNGHSQVFKRAYFRVFKTPDDEELKNVGGIGNTGAPATITFADNDSAQWFYGRLDGHLSVRVSGPKMLGFSSVPTNSMDGTITHSGERGGSGSIVMGGAWPNLKKIESVNGGLVDIRNSVTINPKATIDIDGSSQIKVANEFTEKVPLTVRTLRINGVELPIGTYNKSSPAVDGRFENNGNGYVKVTGAPGFKVLIK